VNKFLSTRLFLLLIVFFSAGSLGVCGVANGLDLDQRKYRVSSIEFFTNANLDYSELLDPLSIRPGDVLTEAKIRQAEEQLMIRGIFEHVESEVYRDAGESKDNVTLRFLLAPRLFISEVDFVGNDTLDRRSLQRFSQLRGGQVLAISDLESARERILHQYVLRGHYQASVSVEIFVPEDRQRAVVKFVIEEGFRAVYNEIKVTGLADPALRAKLQSDVITFFIDVPISRVKSRELAQRVLGLLRREGYLQVSAEIGDPNYEALNGWTEIGVDISLGPKVLINFEGNEYFEDEELLEPLKMDSRSVPFSPNAIHSLRRDIKRLYQERGFYLAVVELENETFASGQRSFLLKIQENQVYRLTKIRFSGASAFLSSELLEVIKSQTAKPWPLGAFIPGFVIDEVVDEDAQRLIDYYAEHGYFDARVEPTLSRRGNTSELELLFTVSEGSPKVVEQVVLEWSAPTKNTETVAESLAPLLSLQTEIKQGSLYNREVIEEERRRINAVLRERGFPNATVESRFDRDAQVLRFAIDCGPQVRIGEIFIRGNTYTKDYVIKRRLQFASNELWREKQIAGSQKALYADGFYGSALIRPRDGVIDSSSEDLVVEIQERDTAGLDLGLSFTTDNGVNIRTEIAERNLFGRGQTVLLGANGFVKTGDAIFDAARVRLAYLYPYIFGTGVDFSTEAFIQTSISLLDQFSYDRVGVAATVRETLADNLKATFGVVTYEEDLYDVAPDVIIGREDRGSNLFSSLNTGLDYDRRDNEYYPRSGYRVQLRGGLALPEFGSDLSYVDGTSQFSYFHPTTRRLVWANNLHLQAAEPLNGDDIIGIGKRYFLGGRNSLRGFSRGAVGPRGFLSNIAGGDRSAQITTELRYDLSETFVGVLFLDVGQSFLRNRGTFTGDPKRLEKPRFSPGFGIHIRTPVGPIIAEYGFALDREFGERFGRFHLDVGGSF
jgi:outer membrane protein insertion porin family